VFISIYNYGANNHESKQHSQGDCRAKNVMRCTTPFIIKRLL
jgi:hypothetical protein